MNFRAYLNIRSVFIPEELTFVAAREKNTFYFAFQQRRKMINQFWKHIFHAKSTCFKLYFEYNTMPVSPKLLKLGYGQRWGTFFLAHPVFKVHKSSLSTPERLQYLRQGPRAHHQGQDGERPGLQVKILEKEPSFEQGSFNGPSNEGFQVQLLWGSSTYWALKAIIL